MVDDLGLQDVAFKGFFKGSLRDPFRVLSFRVSDCLGV